MVWNDGQCADYGATAPLLASDVEKIDVIRLNVGCRTLIKKCEQLRTGGNSGIGLATAKHFVQEGAYVFITGRHEPELVAAVKEIGRNVTGVQGDVSNLADLDRLFAQIKREKGKLDIVFAKKKALPLLPDGASIILNASIVASKGLPANSVYSATKAAVRSFARTWTTDLRDRRIRVNPVSPGPTDTPGLNELLASTKTGQQRKKMLSNSVPLGSVHPMRSRRPWCFSHPTTAATSQERSCLWMAASHKFRPQMVEGHGIDNRL